MSKFLTILLAGLFVFAAAVPAMATDARQAALAFTGNYIEDDYNIFSWYATLPSYSNMVWIGMQDLEWYSGDDMFYYIGASYGLGEEGKYGTLAAFFYSYAPGLNPWGYGEWDGAGLFSDWLPNKFTVMYAYPMEKLSLGLFFQRSDQYAKQEQDVEGDLSSQELSRAYTTFGLGLRFDLGEKLYADLAADMSMANYKYEVQSGGESASLEDDAHSMYGVRARAFYEWNETITWVPYFNFRMFDFSLKAENIDEFESYGDKGTMLDFGLGANVKVNEDNLLIFAVEPYSMMKREPSEPPDNTSAEIKYTVMPRFYLALESDIKDWLTFRVGGSKELGKSDWTYEETGVGKAEQVYTGESFGFYMGLGFHVGDFDIDCLLNNDLPFHLGYWLTGYAPYDSYEGYGYEWPMYMISATYGF